jgi:anhydro-N-acetylmuramic acid kinase
MTKQEYFCLGIMSGTSLDGIDLAHIHFTLSDNKWNYQLLQTATVPYSQEWVNTLQNAIHFNPEQLASLNHQYTLYLAQTINAFLRENNILNLDAICSHGHTILHQPQNGFTLQIGNLPLLGELVNHTVVCDFRVQDVQLGGQGAPLVPIGDRLLFSEHTYCLNLGGFSNVSFEQDSQRIAFDISPVNTVLNHYALQLGKPYDNKGEIARSGTIHPELEKALNTLEYYQKTPPKSLGMEYVLTTVLPLMDSYAISIPDKLSTFTEHIAYQISQALPHKNASLLITGGGAWNNYLIERLQVFLPNMQCVIPDSKTLEFKEALIFGLLGILKLRNEINTLSSVTGASHDHSAGVIYNPTFVSKARI